MHAYAWRITPVHENIFWRGNRKGVGVWKVGETTQTLDARIKQDAPSVPSRDIEKLYFHTDVVLPHGKVYHDKDFIKWLNQQGIHSYKDPETTSVELVEATEEELLAAYDAYVNDQPLNLERPLSYEPRPEQEAAVERIVQHFHPLTKNDPFVQRRFLLYAKMRYGKTYTTYLAFKELQGKLLMVLTHKPSIRNTWQKEAQKHVAFTGWRFATADTPVEDVERWQAKSDTIVYFASFQDILGITKNGAIKDRTNRLASLPWDMIALDEYHFGSWNERSQAAFATTNKSDMPEEQEDFSATVAEEAVAQQILTQQFDATHYLYISGTPFRSLETGEFDENQTFNWTYVDEQEAKQAWQAEEGLNPYLELPEVEIMLYQMPDSIRSNIAEQEDEYNLHNLLKTTKNLETGKPVFEHEEEITLLLDYMCGMRDMRERTKADLYTNSTIRLPFTNTSLGKSSTHSFWLLPNVASVNAMADLIENHQVLSNRFKVLRVAGDRSEVDAAHAEDYVTKAIENNPQGTITLSCGKLSTGSSIAKWDSVVLLTGTQSLETWWQTAFRAGTPDYDVAVDPIRGEEIKTVHKTKFAVYDFDRDRSFKMLYDLSVSGSTRGTVQEDTAAADVLGSTIITDPISNLDHLIEVAHVYDFNGDAMTTLDARQVHQIVAIGVSSSMIVQQFKSMRLIGASLAQLEKVLKDQKSVDILGKLQFFRKRSGNVDKTIRSLLDLEKKAVEKTHNPKTGKEEATPEAKKAKQKLNKEIKELRDNLSNLLQRLPLFMYLTDERQDTVEDILVNKHPELFEEATGITLKDFERLNEVKLFNTNLLNQTVIRFRLFEEKSLSYLDLEKEAAHRETEEYGQEILGGYNIQVDKETAHEIAGFKPSDLKHYYDRRK